MEYPRTLSRRLPCIFAIVAIAAAAVAADLPSDLGRCAELSTSGRFAEIITILSPYESKELGDEARYIVSAELGRAHFHTGSYRAAHNLFRRAVKLRPDRVETALYLQASSWVVGDRTQALSILDSVLASGARDLWLAVTLPGEGSFLGAADVWDVLHRHEVPLPVDAIHGRVFGVELGQNRSVVERRLGVAHAETSAPVLTATAGPEMIWAFRFDPAGALRGVTLYADRLLRYTPYRLQLGDAPGWQLSPESARHVFGEPDRQSASTDGGISLRWDRETFRLVLDFAVVTTRRLPVYPPSENVLSTLRLEALPSAVERSTE